MRKQKILVVDEEDKVIGSKDRDEVNQKDIYRVSALWIRNSRGDSLLAQRALTKSHHPGKWGPAVAGTVEEGEDYGKNIYKEAEEEIGLTGEIFKTGPKERESGVYDHFTQWYIVEIDKPEKEFVVDKREVERIKWFSKQELREEISKNPDKFLKAVIRWFEIFSK